MKDGTENFTVTMSDDPTLNVEVKPEEVVIEDNPPEAINEEKPKQEVKEYKNRTQKRIESLIREKHELAREVESLKAIQEPATKDKELNPDDFEDYDDYLVAIAEPEKKPAKQDKKPPYDEMAIVIEQVQEKFEDVREKYPDFNEKVTNPDLAITPDMLKVINESDDAGEVAYYLANNPDEAKRLASLSTSRVAIEIGKIEYKLSRPEKVEIKPQLKQKTTNAPAPITPVGGTDEYVKSASEMSFSEFEKHRNDQDRGHKFW